MSLHVEGDINIARADLHYLNRDLAIVYDVMENAMFDAELLQTVKTAIELAEDVDACVEEEVSDWEKYMSYYEEEDLNPEIREGLAELRNIIGNETQITVGNSQNTNNGYVTFVNGNYYSNFLTYAAAESEIRSILTGIELERGRKGVKDA